MRIRVIDTLLLHLYELLEVLLLDTFLSCERFLGGYTYCIVVVDLCIRDIIGLLGGYETGIGGSLIHLLQIVIIMKLVGALEWFLWGSIGIVSLIILIEIAVGLLTALWVEREFCLRWKLRFAFFLRTLFLDLEGLPCNILGGILLLIESLHIWVILYFLLHELIELVIRGAWWNGWSCEVALLWRQPGPT